MMIEFKNVKKIYKTKKGVETVALNNINFKLGNKGMIFIVGKSGSGKSTLLNLLGGLDSLTNGEILINNRNIGTFNNKEYDSYRNTYVGFIFQEFNVLEQYNVYENIQLATKLQNITTPKNKIDNLLKKLGIENLGERRINELSGGQKQRVAIARALIKNPQIILADEPTGNLDQNSSKQIFDSLKEISKDKLVIVVSHDIESANTYADRIIKLEDGNIVSDNAENNEFIEEKFNLKKSKLPISYALKMAINSFKFKPFKLFMTILLTAISLIFMGFTLNCKLFEANRLEANVMKDNNNYVYDVYKTKVIDKTNSYNLKLTDDDYKKIENLTKSKLNIGYLLNDNGNSLKFQFGALGNQSGYYDKDYMKYLSYTFVEISDDRLLENIIGKIPNKTDEIVIHKYLADYIIENGIITSNNEIYKPNNYNELISSNESIKLGENKVKIVGIVNDDDSLYLDAKKNNYFSDKELDKYFDFNYRDKARLVYVKGFTENAMLREDKESILRNIYIGDYTDTIIEHDVNQLKDNIKIVTDTDIVNISKLEKNEIVVSVDTIKKFDRKFQASFEEYLNNNRDSVYEESLNNFLMLYMKNNKDKLKYLLNISTDEYLYNSDGDFDVKKPEVTIIGISLDGNNYISSKYIDEYIPTLKTPTKFVKIYDDNVNNLIKTFNKMPLTDLALETGIHYTLRLDNDMDIANVINTYKYLDIYLLIISLVFVLFTILLFSNFLAISISYCKKEIGILRALGATTKDVVKIFGYEAIIIGFMSWILSMVGLFIVTNLLNKSLFKNLFFTLNGIIIHPLVPISMLLFVVVIAMLITIISVSKVTHIKPIDAILNK